MSRFQASGSFYTLRVIRGGMEKPPAKIPSRSMGLAKSIQAMDEVPSAAIMMPITIMVPMIRMTASRLSMLK